MSWLLVELIRKGKWQITRTASWIIIKAGCTSGQITSRAIRSDGLFYRMDICHTTGKLSSKLLLAKNHQMLWKWAANQLQVVHVCSSFWLLVEVVVHIFSWQYCCLWPTSVLFLLHNVRDKWNWDLLCCMLSYLWDLPAVTVLHSFQCPHRLLDCIWILHALILTL